MSEQRTARKRAPARSSHRLDRLRPPLRRDPDPSPRRGGDAVAIGTYTGTDDTFTDSLEEFAQVDADQAEQDHGQLKEPHSDGKIPIQAGI